MKQFNDEAADFDFAETEMIDVAKKNLMVVDVSEPEHYRWDFNNTESPESKKAMEQYEAQHNKIKEAIDTAFEKGYDGVLFKNLNQSYVFNSGRKIHDQAFLFSIKNPDVVAPRKPQTKAIEAAVDCVLRKLI